MKHRPRVRFSTEQIGDTECDHYWMRPPGEVDTNQLRPDGFVLRHDRSGRVWRYGQRLGKWWGWILYRTKSGRQIRMTA